MAVTLYTLGLDEWDTWTADTYGALLLNDAGYVVDRDHEFIDDLNPGVNEVSVTGYARSPMAAPTITPDLGNNWLSYDCDDWDFGTPDAGENVTALVVFKFVTNDADSPVLAYQPLGTIPTAGLPFVIGVNLGGVIRKRQAP